MTPPTTDPGVDPATSSPSTPPAAQPAPLDRGDIVNLMGRFRRRLREEGRKITVVQNRLIMQRIEAADVIGEDARRPRQQIARIAGVVAEVTAMEAGRVEEVLVACW